MNKIKIPQMKPVEKLADNGFLSFWCCDCGSRHIFHFHIIKGKEDYIIISHTRDEVGEKVFKKNAGK